MSVELLPVPLSDRKLVDRFIKIPWYIHREHHPSTHWVPPLILDRRDYLNPDKNPFFTHATCAFWIARKDGRDVGRIAAVHDADWEKFQGNRTGSFGMFDSPNDTEVSSALLQAATDWLREQGRDHVIGPLDLSTNYVSGALIEGFDTDPSMEMAYNPPYYKDLFEAFGFGKEKDLWQWYLSSSTPIPEKVVRVSEKIRKRAKVELRPMNLKKWQDEVSLVWDIYNDAWEQNWGFVPVGEAEFRHIAEGLKQVIHPSMAFMAEVEGEPVAFAISIMNVNPILKTLNGRLFPFGLLKLLWKVKIRKQVKDCRLIVLGVKAGYRRRGIDSILFVATHQGANDLGWEGGEIGWTLDDNDMINRSIESMKGHKVKTYRVFGMPLS